MSRQRPYSRPRGWRLLNAGGLTAALPALLVLGCGEGSSRSGSGRGTGDQADRPPVGWEVRELFRFESVETPAGRTAFGSVQGVEMDDDGNVYVLDGQAAVIHVVDSQGTYLRTMGGSGRGPGEFRNPNGLLITPAGGLWVSDPNGGRYTLFELTGALAGTYRRAFSAGWGPYWDAVDLRDGTIYEPTSIRRQGTDEILSVFLGLRPVDGQMEAVDTVLRLPAFEPERWEALPMATRSGGMAMIMSGSIPVPLSPASRDRLDPRGGFWAGVTDALRLVRVSWNGDTLGILENPAARARPVTAQDRDRLLEELSGQIEAGLQVEPEKIPERMPYWDRFWVDPGGRLWVERFRPPGTDASEPHDWEVYGDDGGFLGLLRLPLAAQPTPVLRNGRLVGTVKDELDVDWVVVFEVETRDTSQGPE